MQLENNPHSDLLSTLTIDFDSPLTCFNNIKLMKPEHFPTFAKYGLPRCVSDYENHFSFQDITESQFLAIDSPRKYICYIGFNVKNHLNNNADLLEMLLLDSDTSNTHGRSVIGVYYVTQTSPRYRHIYFVKKLIINWVRFDSTYADEVMSKKLYNQNSHYCHNFTSVSEILCRENSHSHLYNDKFADYLNWLEFQHIKEQLFTPANGIYDNCFLDTKINKIPLIKKYLARKKKKKRAKSDRQGLVPYEVICLDCHKIEKLINSASLDDCKINVPSKNDENELPEMSKEVFHDNKSFSEKLHSKMGIGRTTMPLIPIANKNSGSRKESNNSDSKLKKLLTIGSWKSNKENTFDEEVNSTRDKESLVDRFKKKGTASHDSYSILKAKNDGGILAESSTLTVNGNEDFAQSPKKQPGNCFHGEKKTNDDDAQWPVIPNPKKKRLLFNKRSDLDVYMEYDNIKQGENGDYKFVFGDDRTKDDFQLDVSGILGGAYNNTDYL
ncbi:uncharacterized protein SCDLUD_001499 [Saccharomycodes ludwigii]|uniref:uncharacterized protein n=1 Tax=Saccharomycodes ludwigii TaxID=36035 RepID=UPI001E86CA05|nr:hypothetical protein SCDLUD_001499 [Saccharomycodes ludwigii]KAH3901726.1 hypothetical protein SCDLUD_001499 [Saccharomycodes ludwigii]